LDGEHAAVPVGQLGGRQEGGDLFGAVVGEQPSFDEGVYVIKLRDFDQEGRHGGGAAGDEFEISEGGEKGGAATLGIVPTLSLLKPESGEQAEETVEFSAWRAGRGHGADNRDSLNHRFDCIVWEYRTIAAIACSTALPRGETCELRDAAV
jgi:hypothetical protein